jgi:hypothetical protein
MTDRERSILQYVARFGASRASDIYMFSTGGPPNQSEINNLIESGHLEKYAAPAISKRSDRIDEGKVYWSLTCKGRKAVA